MNKILCFDVSNNSCSVAIAFGQEVLAFEQDLRPSMQAELLLVMIESVLQKAKMKYSDLEYLAVTIGPGSFTGIRIGLSAAKGMLHATKLKGLAITNFEAAYYRLVQQVTRFDTAFIVLNAYRNQVYVQEFVGGKSKAPELVDNTKIRMMIQDSSGLVACAGSGLSVVYEDIKDLSNLMIVPRFPTIKAMHIARLADNMIIKDKFRSIEPLYIRPPDAIIPK